MKRTIKEPQLWNPVFTYKMCESISLGITMVVYTSTKLLIIISYHIHTVPSGGKVTCLESHRGIFETRYRVTREAIFN